MKTEYYKASGRFEAHNKLGILITDQFFINKIFEAYFPAAAKNMAIAYAKRMAARKYGKGTTIEQADNLRIQKSHAPKKRKKKAIKIKYIQEKLF
ncbi:MAG: hypothetical protein NT136_02270 [Candidatus Moranbacteria bacterium]|nr:hypothetical protein [Candidatus Moranbacteria bacterium]